MSGHKSSRQVRSIFTRAIVESLESRRLLTLLTVVNAGFESPGVADGDGTDTVDGWAIGWGRPDLGPEYGGPASASIQNPTDDQPEKRGRSPILDTKKNGDGEKNGDGVRFLTRSLLRLSSRACRGAHAGLSADSCITC